MSFKSFEKWSSLRTYNVVICIRVTINYKVFDISSLNGKRIQIGSEK